MKKLGNQHTVSMMACDNEMAIWIDPGEMLEIETQNWFASQRNYAQELADAVHGIDINPSTGPVGVRGAEKGDILQVDILDIQLMDQGIMFTFPGSGILGSEMTEIKNTVIEMRDGYAHFNAHIRIPLKPMIGVIGTSPVESVPCFLPGQHGGNMDNQHVGAGSSIYLPVYTSGGGLSLGDLHGVMGDGEISEWGLETSGKVLIKTHIIKQKDLTWPVLETKKDIYFVVSMETIDSAIQEAVRYLVQILQQADGLSKEEAVSLVSLIGHVEICQVVNPIKTIRLRVSKEVIGITLLEAILA